MVSWIHQKRKRLRIFDPTLGKAVTHMTLAGELFRQYSVLQYAEFLLRVLAACICGACIGVERTKRLKEAGVRTHVIVCCAAALTMIVSKYGFADLVSETGQDLFGSRGTDPARLAAQIISGISFLGAGIIFRNGGSVRGLTTAAGIWATAGIGLAFGAGMYVIGVIGTLIVAIIQIIMHKYTIGADSYMFGQMSCTVTDPAAFRKAFDDYIASQKMQVIANKISYHEDGSASFDFTIRMHSDTTVNDLTTFLESVDCVRSLSCRVER